MASTMVPLALNSSASASEISWALVVTIMAHLERSKPSVIKSTVLEPTK